MCRLDPLTVWQRSCILTGHQQIKPACIKKPRALKYGECLLLFGQGSFVYRPASYQQTTRLKYTDKICLLFYKNVTPASLILRKENRLRVLRRVLRKICGIRGRSNRRLEKTALCLHDWYCS